MQLIILFLPPSLFEQSPQILKQIDDELAYIFKRASIPYSFNKLLFYNNLLLDRWIKRIKDDVDKEN